MLNVNKTNYYSKPFEYFVGSDAFEPSICSEVLDWFEFEAPWQLVETDFYEQFEFDFLNIKIPNRLSSVCSNTLLTNLREDIENLFRVKLSEKVDVTAHKLICGQRIRIHNDFVPSQESHRVIIQLNRGWDKHNGGLLMLFNSANPTDVHKVIVPVHNSFLGFAISSNSNHAVSTIYQGERYTLVYSFYKR